MVKNRIALMLSLILLLSLACSFSFNADLGNNDDNLVGNDSSEIIVQNQTEETLIPSDENPNAAGGDEGTPVETPTEGSTTGTSELRSADEVYDECGDENQFTSPAGQIYAEVLIKSGPTTLSFTDDINDGCYEISGLGTTSVTINRIGDGRDCKEIGGLGLIYGE